MLDNRWYIDGLDIWDSFGVFIESGEADFLRYAAKKDSITHDWRDSDGIEVDLTHIYLKEREIKLNMCLVADGEQDFINKHDAFIAWMTRPQLRRFEIASHGNKQYFVYYKETTNWTQVEPLRGIAQPRWVGQKFIMTIVEPEPKVNGNTIEFIVDEEGRFLVT